MSWLLRATWFVSFQTQVGHFTISNSRTNWLWTRSARLEQIYKINGPDLVSCPATLYSSLLSQPQNPTLLSVIISVTHLKISGDFIFIYILFLGFRRSWLTSRRVPGRRWSTRSHWWRRSARRSTITSRRLRRHLTRITRNRSRPSLRSPRFSGFSGGRNQFTMFSVEESVRTSFLSQWSFLFILFYLKLRIISFRRKIYIWTLSFERSETRIPVWFVCGCVGCRLIWDRDYFSWLDAFMLCLGADKISELVGLISYFFYCCVRILGNCRKKNMGRKMRTFVFFE